MSKLVGVLSVLLVLLVAMGFAAANAGNRVTLSLGFITLYQVPVTLVAFSGLFVGMLVMFATGVHTDLKVRRVLRDRLAEESLREQGWIDRNQQDLFAEGSGPEGGLAEGGAVEGGDGQGAPAEGASKEGGDSQSAVAEAAHPESGDPPQEASVKMEETDETQ